MGTPHTLGSLITAGLLPLCADPRSRTLVLDIPDAQYEGYTLATLSCDTLLEISTGDTLLRFKAGSKWISQVCMRAI